MNDQELPQEIQLLLRDLSQAARTMLDVGGSMKYAVDMFRLQLRREALARTENGKNQCQAARILKEHRNNFTRGMRQHEQCRAASRMPVRSQRVHKVSAQIAG